MRHCFLILTIALFASASAQKVFDSLQTERTLLTLPSQTNQITADQNIIRAIETIDKNYRQIADTLYGYRSLKHTILQTILIETNDSIFINPLAFGHKIRTTNIIFSNKYLNIKVGNIAKALNKTERTKLFIYLKNNYDHFSVKEKKLHAQPVRIRYIKFPDDKSVHAGIDIYGAHFLWTIDRTNNWDVTKVERLWVY